MASVYIRVKNASGWRYQCVEQGRGRKTGALSGPFFARPAVDGKQVWHKLAASTFEQAKAESALAAAAVDAARQGLAVTEAEALANRNRISLQSAVNSYLDLKRSKRPKTVGKYTHALNRFIKAANIRFLDEIDVDVLRKFKRAMEDQGYSNKTIKDEVSIVTFLLKKNDVKARLPKDEIPVIEEEPATPYSDEELKKLFASIDKVSTGTTKKRASAEIVAGREYSGLGFGQAARFKFFLGTAARDKEVTYAAWSDIDFDNKTYHIRGKKDVGFMIKNHEARVVPIPDSLVELLKARKKNAPNERWVFVNEDGKPDNHFLRKLKVIALRGGLNCGHCKSTVTKGRYEKKHEVAVTCKTDPICEHWVLHRFRKTCATRWHTNNIPVRTIQHWLGHKNLETTQIYLGVISNSDAGLRNNINQAYGD
jgi:integrase/recombinase XerD